MMKNKTIVSAIELRRLLRYEPETGKFFHRISQRVVGVGEEAGWHDKQTGYIHTSVKGRIYKAHRLAWLYVCGEWPKNDIDHINGARNDNRFENLREATRSQNNANAILRKDSTSGFKGVCFHRPAKKWMARIKNNGRQNHLGLFDSPEAAHEAYREAARELFGDFARFG